MPYKFVQLQDSPIHLRGTTQNLPFSTWAIGHPEVRPMQSRCSRSAQSPAPQGPHIAQEPAEGLLRSRPDEQSTWELQQGAVRGCFLGRVEMEMLICIKPPCLLQSLLESNYASTLLESNRNNLSICFISKELLETRLCQLGPLGALQFGPGGAGDLRAAVQVELLKGFASGEDLQEVFGTVATMNAIETPGSWTKGTWHW